MRSERTDISLPTGTESASRPTRVRYIVLVWLCAAAAIAYIQRNSIGVAEKTIRLELGLSMEQMGLVMSAFMLTYAIFQLPSGWLAHVWGSRRALSFFSALWSAVTALFALAASFPALVLARLGMGAAQAGIFPCATSSIAKWFPNTRRGLASGALGSFMSVGGLLGGVLTALLLEYISWQWLFVLFAIPGIIWALGFYAWFRDDPRDHPSVNHEELSIIGPAQADMAKPTSHAPAPTPWGAILTSPAMWLICGQQFFRAAAYNFYAFWFPTFLQDSRGLSRLDAGFLQSLPFWGVVAGGLVGGTFADWVLVRTGSRRWSRQGVALLSMTSATLMTLLTFAVDNTIVVVLLFSAAAFCAALAAPCGYTITIDMGGKHVTTVFSMMNMAGNIGATLLPAIVPLLVLEREFWATPASAASATGHLGGPGSAGPFLASAALISSRLTNWNLVVLGLAGVYLAAGLCWLLINPNGTIGEGRAKDNATSAC
jgi:sugar phosphate permease